jgi:septal ring factor EnvC (AmiA/AmiB activator)
VAEFRWDQEEAKKRIARRGTAPAHSDDQDGSLPPPPCGREWTEEEKQARRERSDRDKQEKAQREFKTTKEARLSELRSACEELRKFLAENDGGMSALEKQIADLTSSLEKRKKNQNNATQRLKEYAKRINEIERVNSLPGLLSVVYPTPPAETRRERADRNSN